MKVESRLDRPLARRQARENMPLERLQHPVEREEKLAPPFTGRVVVPFADALRRRHEQLAAGEHAGLQARPRMAATTRAAQSPCATSRRSARY